MKFAELAGNMWDTPARLVLEMVKKRGNTVTTISEDEKAKWIKTTEPVIETWIKQVKDKGLDGGKLLEQARAWLPSTTRREERSCRAPALSGAPQRSRVLREADRAARNSARVWGRGR
jgi:hypothetical protein